MAGRTTNAKMGPAAALLTYLHSSYLGKAQIRLLSPHYIDWRKKYAVVWSTSHNLPDITICDTIS